MAKNEVNSRSLSASVFLAVLAVVFAALFTGLDPAKLHADEQRLWRAISKGEAFAIMRHELAPGIGDPDNFELGDCSTQRNLNDTGRERARVTGERFRANGVAQADVLTSQWCRCRETAELLRLGSVEPLPVLNSFFEEREKAEARTSDLKAWLAARANSAAAAKPLVLVTHQVNISALTGRGTSSGEIIVARYTGSGIIEVLGSL